MVMNFSGQYKRGRTINLGGRNASQNSKEAILRRAQASREERERARKQEKAALTIQSFYRGRIDVFRSRILIRRDWDQRYSGLGMSRYVITNVTHLS
jgi:ubiquitin-protein ligase E3 C